MTFKSMLDLIELMKTRFVKIKEMETIFGLSRRSAFRYINTFKEIGYKIEHDYKKGYKIQQPKNNR